MIKQKHILQAEAGAETASASTRVKVCDKSFDSDTGAFTFAFTNGKSIEGNLSDFAADIQKQLGGHGLLQKGGDSYAGVKGNVAEAYANCSEVIEQLKAGVWAGGGEGGPRIKDLAEAIARIKSVTIEAATTAVTAATDELRKQWRSNPRVKSVMATIAAEKAAEALAAAGDEQLEISL